ncbi:MAG: fumarylacetoacetate hydrolase family protein [Gammaproteobacteria bacterium]|nr:fumarylacetoacetate hydrolase family protein [Gammaproteobacteria bacterium]
MKKWLLIAGVVLVLLLVVSSFVLTRPAFDARLEGDPLQGLKILPLEQGLTLARSSSEETTRLLLVREATSEGLKVVDVGRATGRPLDDPMVALTLFGYDELDYIARKGVEELVSIDTLTVPLVAGESHIAAGTNYKAHAEETGIEGGPFLFPKLTTATGWNAAVPMRTRLDYEAELCAVPLSRVISGGEVQFGYVLCNDFTDRWPLARDVDFDQPMGTTGFPEGKGGPGMMPLGPFLLVPRDHKGFYPEVELELYLNGDLRQKSMAGLMIWSPQEIAEQALAACEQDYIKGEEKLRLVDCEGISGGSILLTGTPEGVLMHQATIWNPLAYLRTGDEVILRARYCGVLRNVVE